MHEVLVNRLGGLSLPRKSVVRLTDRPDMTLDVYRGRKTTMQQQQQRAEILQAYVHACVIVLQYNTPVNDLFLQKCTAREDSGCAVSSESALLQLQPRIMIRTSVHA